ncbi:glycosyltransferase family 4 protein [Chitinophaga sancti]|uniref:Glycosyltransferase family 4 protein n=1 Tax=Chitinophaga sancti TaxID=1004 RepID=A0A1K1MRQ0_9BACT|nr:glycosyltransferase family 4 protein [Chitinophaga sancti]WQD62923.1 glycosyltransferase family 4 protein [Chitinophaga sancti]WQG91452.1 glycosyltransferase family 4 protein [Chitinophaga sancti]SFW25848.1 Glycosyltransferase involved in cell wall bisynthesis [Chitinophaga sancti]
MKVVLCIDGLGSGGAQRQIVILAELLIGKGHTVEFITYLDDNFYKEVTDRLKINVVTVKWTNLFSRTYKYLVAVKQAKPDYVISFLDNPNLISELASVPFRKWGLIVSERTGKVGKISTRDKVRFHFHRLADVVVTNSYNLSEYVVNHAPWLKKKMHTIVNAVDFEKFRPMEVTPPANGVVKIVVAASYQQLKNSENLIKAIHSLKGLPVELYWYGNKMLVDGVPQGTSRYLDAAAYVKEHGLEKMVFLDGPSREIPRLFNEATVVCLPSFYEGCPNVICEAMACGKPVLASNVCDNPRLIREGVNGFLFDPADPASIAAAIKRLMALSPAQLQDMSRENLAFAAAEFDKSVFLNKYLNLLTV